MNRGSTMIRVIIDFETASACSLKDAGAAAYSEHWSTEVLCLVWQVGGEAEFGVWCPSLPEYADITALRALARRSDVIFVSHASFEQFIWKNIMVPLGLPEMPPERWEDTQATAAWRSLPLQLEKLMKVIDLPFQKDMEGSRLTVSLSKPNKKTGMLDRSPETLRRVVEYCKTDVACEAAVLRTLGDLSPAERKVWLLDQEINHRGVRLDMEFVRQAQLVVDRATPPLLEEFRDITGGINPGQVAKVIEWCGAQGVALENLQKGYLAELLGEGEEDDDSSATDEGGDWVHGVGLPKPRLPGNVERVLTIRGMLGSASIKKLARMQACVGLDGRARGLLQYHAAHPGRWGGRLLQPQNFPRGEGKVRPDAAVAAILSGEPAVVEATFQTNAIAAVAASLRHAIVAGEGRVFEVGDFAGIEARIVLALAGQHEKCALIAAGEDPYLDFACQMFHKPAGFYTKDDKDIRFKGKGGVLGCGFQCGPDNFNVKFLKGADLETAELTVHTYRKEWAPKVPVLWEALKHACMDCVKFGCTVEVYGCTFRREGDFMAIDLPSGWQTIWYYRPHLHVKPGWDSPSPHYWAMKAGQWTRIGLYGGLLCENIVQALARGILVAAMERLTTAGKPIVLTVHDEVICEVKEDEADLDRFKAIMEERPEWVARMGVPIEVEAWSGARYRK